MRNIQSNEQKLHTLNTIQRKIIYPVHMNDYKIFNPMYGIFKLMNKNDFKILSEQKCYIWCKKMILKIY